MDKFLLYKTETGEVRVEVLLQDETLWLTQKAIAQLFDKERSVVTKHIKSIFESGELIENSVCAKFAHTAKDGKTYETNSYNLDMIISVGYRVNSLQATQFPIWATKTLKEYIIKGFVLDDERLKQGQEFFGNPNAHERLARFFGRFFKAFQLSNFERQEENWCVGSQAESRVGI
jgi:hypothetical protein